MTDNLPERRKLPLARLEEASERDVYRALTNNHAQAFGLDDAVKLKFRKGLEGIVGDVIENSDNMDALARARTLKLVADMMEMGRTSAKDAMELAEKEPPEELPDLTMEEAEDLFDE